MKKLNKKGVFPELSGMAIGVATILVILVVGFLIAASVKTQIGVVDADIENANTSECPKSVSCNATTQIVDAVATIPGWVGLIILVGIGGILLAMIKRFG